MLSKNHNEMKLNLNINVTIAPDIINTTYSNGICHTSNFIHFIAFSDNYFPKAFTVCSNWFVT